jgi:hypothetical protein
MKISFGNMTVELNIFNISKQPLEYDEVRSVCLIEEIIEKVVDESNIEDPLRHALLSSEMIWTWTSSYLCRHMRFWSLLLWKAVRIRRQ